MTATHFKNFWGAGALCQALPPGELLSLRPELVTCIRCLAMMGRASLGVDERRDAHAGFFEQDSASPA